MDGKTNIFIVAGESSGDLHSSLLMREIIKIKPNVSFFGIGGSRMGSLGLESLVELSSISVVGFVEVVKNLKLFKETFDKCEKIFCNERIDLLICVDFPGFNLRLVKLAKKYNIPVCYYIAPQLWAWGRKRIELIQKYVDLLLVVFPFEVEFFSKYHSNVYFVGHPLMDLPTFSESILSFSQREDSIAILPGSRRIEFFHHHKLISKLIEIIRSKYPNYSIKIPVVYPENVVILKKLLGDLSQSVVFEQDSLEILKKSKVGIIKSGTSNLEAALLGLPFVMFYKTSLPTYLLARQLVNLNHISIVNILLNENFVPEFIQGMAKPYRIFSALQTILQSPEIYLQMQSSFLRLRKMLGGEGASEKAAKKIVQFFGL